jgi:hypothetical protein
LESNAQTSQKAGPGRIFVSLTTRDVVPSLLADSKPIFLQDAQIFVEVVACQIPTITGTGTLFTERNKENMEDTPRPEHCDVCKLVHGDSFCPASIVM